VKTCHIYIHISGKFLW